MEIIKEELNIPISDKDRLSFLEILGMSVRRRMKIFAEEVSIEGLNYLFKPSNNRIGSVIRKVMWTMLLLFGAGFMVFQIYDRVSYYFTYPTIVKYQLAYNESLSFPTVTICSEVIASQAAVMSFGKKIIIIISRGFSHSDWCALWETLDKYTE